LFAIVAGLTPQTATAQGSEQPQATLSRAGASSWDLGWHGLAGRTYFPQYSLDLQSWAYFRTIQSGTGQMLSWTFDSTASKFFVRLRYTDQATDNPLSDDFDGDGLSNWAEIDNYQTDPFKLDTDEDAIVDRFEVLNGLDPRVADASLDLDHDGVVNFEDAEPSNPSVGRFTVTIASPIDGGNYP
jgi:hypothetical protein